METVRSKVKFEGCFVVDNVGHSSGLAVLWREQHQVRVLAFSKNFVDMEVVDKHGVKTRATGSYGLPEGIARHESWNLLQGLAQHSQDPWCVIGYFNDQLLALLRGFQEAVDDCQLIELPLLGYQYTWAKARGKPHAVEERLD
ncbi:hypothetical protein LINGRAHAP2_LOCUS11086 [Linum grandiflorum]